MLHKFFSRPLDPGETSVWREVQLRMESLVNSWRRRADGAEVNAEPGVSTIVRGTRRTTPALRGSASVHKIGVLYTTAFVTFGVYNRKPSLPDTEPVNLQEAKKKKKNTKMKGKWFLMTQESKKEKRNLASPIPGIEPGSMLRSLDERALC